MMIKCLIKILTKIKVSKLMILTKFNKFKRINLKKSIKLLKLKLKIIYNMIEKLLL